jgi:5-methylcytosine-specific restriction endonuclease McrA
LSERNGSTRKWRETRKRMLRKLPAICPLCVRWIVDVDSAHIDHVLPVSRGGDDRPSNLRMVHKRCNLSRGNRGVRAVRPAKPSGIRPPQPSTGHWRWSDDYGWVRTSRDW